MYCLNAVPAWHMYCLNAVLSTWIYQNIYYHCKNKPKNCMSTRQSLRPNASEQVWLSGKAIGW